MKSGYGKMITGKGSLKTLNGLNFFRCCTSDLGERTSSTPTGVDEGALQSRNHNEKINRSNKKKEGISD